MNNARSIIAGTAVAGLLGLPFVAAATAPAQGASTPPADAAPLAAGRHATDIRFLDFDHTREYGNTTVIRGQVAVPSLGGAAKGVRVKLYRRLQGSSRWNHLDTRFTSHSSFPKFRFTAGSRANADYRVAYAGNNKLKPSRSSTGVSVYRRIRAKLEDGTGRFHGHIAPHYAHRTVYLDKRSCGSCGWHQVKSDHTGRRGRFSFTVGAPRRGRSFWRVATPASTKFIQSFSSVFTTRLR